MAELFGPDLLLLELLATGGMAEVYRARIKGSGGFQKTVAVKRILPHYSRDNKMQLMFEREVAITSKLQHPNIVTVFRTGLRDGYLYLVMEFVDGRNLLQIQQAVSRQKLQIPLEIACYFGIEVGKALAYAHSFRDEMTGKLLNIVHRDVAPQNIVVSFEGAVRVLDFGIAKAADQVQLTAQGDIKGRTAYLAPELLEGSPPSHQSDLFALGVVLYELLTGQILFGGQGTIEQLNSIIRFDVPSLGQIAGSDNLELEHILGKLLARNPKQRYQLAEEFVRDLSTFFSKLAPSFVPADCGAFLRLLFSSEIERDRALRQEGGASDSFDTQRITTEEQGTDDLIFSDLTELAINAKLAEVTVLPDPFSTFKKSDAMNMLDARSWLYVALFLISVCVPVFYYYLWYQGESNGKGLAEGQITRFSAATVFAPAGARISIWVGSGSNPITALQPDLNYQPVLSQSSEQTSSLTFEDADYISVPNLARILGSLKNFSVLLLVTSVTAERYPIFTLQTSGKSELAVEVNDLGQLSVVTDAGQVSGKIEEPGDSTRGRVYAMIVNNQSVSVYLGARQVLSLPLTAPLSIDASTVLHLGGAPLQTEVSGLRSISTVVLAGRAYSLAELSIIVEELQGSSAALADSA